MQNSGETQPLIYKNAPAISQVNIIYPDHSRIHDQLEYSREIEYIPDSNSRDRTEYAVIYHREDKIEQVHSQIHPDTKLPQPRKHEPGDDHRRRCQQVDKTHDHIKGL